MTYKRKEIIGDCELYLGDCMEVMPLLGKVDCVITDAPYEITGKGGGIGANRSYLSEISTKKLESGFDYSMLGSFDNWAVFCAKRQLVSLINAAEKQGLKWALITWNKPNPTPLTNNNYLPDTEYIIHAFSAGCIYGDYRDKARYIVHNAGGGEFDHPTVKPLPVVKKIMNTSSMAGHTILDPFMGSGTTLVACAEMGRKGIGIEIDADYFDIACKRVDDAYRQSDLFIEKPKT